MRNLLVLCFVLAACGERPPQIITVPAPAAAPTADKPTPLVVSGSATIEVEPDCADLAMTLTGTGARPKQAVAAVTAKQSSLVAAMGKLGVAAKDLRLSLVHLEPQYAVDARGRQTETVTGYRAEIEISATSHDFTQVPALMEAAGDVGASGLTSQFRRSDLAEVRKKARDQALAAARAKAKQFADGLDIKLGPVVQISEGGAGMSWNGSYANSYQVTENAAVAPTATMSAMRMPVTIDVTVGYALPHA